MHNPANKQTNADEDITSLAEVKIWVVQVFSLLVLVDVKHGYASVLNAMDLHLTSSYMGQCPVTPFILMMTSTNVESI